MLKLRVSAEERARCVLATGSGEDAAATRREIVREVARVGNNLNQVARALNRCVLTGDAVNSLAVAAELRRVREALRTL